MTPQSPLMALFQTQDDPEKNQLTDFMNGSVAPGGAPKKKDEDDDALNMAFKGFMTQASQRGEMPDAATFDERWRKNNSPAREFLANFFTGFADSMAGRQFRSVKEQAFLQERAVVEEKQREQTIKQQYAQQMAGILQNEIQSRRDTALKGEIQEMKLQLGEQAQAIRADEIMKRHNLKADEFDQRVREFEEKQATAEKKIEVSRRMAERTGNDLLDFSRNRVMKQFQAKGEDITDPEVLRRMDQAVIQDWENLEKIEGKVKPKGGSARALRPIQHKMLMADGTEQVLLLDPTNLKVVAGTNVGHKITPKIIEDINKLRSASFSLRNALQFAQNSPDAFGTLLQKVPDDLRTILGKLSPEERAIGSRVTDAVMTWITEKTGAAMSDQERKEYVKAVTPLFDSKENWFVGMTSFLGMIDGKMLEKQYNLGLDINPAIMSMMERTKAHMKANKGSAKGLPIPSAEEILYEAARLQKKTIRKNAFGALELVGETK
jgi:hypothetical protein